MSAASATTFSLPIAIFFVNENRSCSSLFDATKERRERACIDVHHRLIRFGLREVEERGVQALVEDAVAVSIEPQDLDAVAALAREDEESAALRIERELLLHDER